MKIAAFDFDGTITTKDTFVEFICFAKGKFAFGSGFALFSPLLIAYKLRLYPNWKVKQQIFSFFFKGMKLADFDKLCADFTARNFPDLLNLKSLKAIEEHLQNGAQLVVISASPENWVRPFAEKLGISNVLCTELEINNEQRLTGKFASKNCYGQEKVNRLLQQYPNRNEYYLVAYGDSRGDSELLAFADEKYLF
ncbi:MAG: haloacid dehalogenase-like hydrolase [Dysgonamonadaceae bacterium]|jgi:HAD superfamily hydrolase (TIGR01490 family)|nr:haloacid dehalogenase-like hydrolase [Dysgonamonadaceae bacterium]